MLDFEHLKDAAQLSPLTLAYIGDAVYELYVRRKLLQKCQKVHSMHQLAIKRVNNMTQASLLLRVMPQLTEQEAVIAKRGRNAKGAYVPKNADVVTYRKATGLEALVGYLYLQGDEKRLNWLLDQIDLVIEETTNHENHQF